MNETSPPDLAEPPPDPAAAPKRPLLPPWLSMTLRIALVAALLYWIFQKVDFVEFAHTLRNADARFLALAALAIVLSQFTAAWRWFRLLKAAGSKPKADEPKDVRLMMLSTPWPVIAFAPSSACHSGGTTAMYPA